MNNLDSVVLGLTLAHWLVLLSILIGVAGSLSYIRDTIRGKTRPNRVSWGMWALAPLIGTAAAISAGADPWATSRIFLAGFVPLIVFLVSFANRQSYWQLTVFDFLCGACSAVALVAWLFAESPELAVLLAATGDGLAALPTLRKAWTYPETENGVIFITSLIGVLLVLPSIPEWNIINSAFQIYLLAINAALIVAIYRKRIFS